MSQHSLSSSEADQTSRYPELVASPMSRSDSDTSDSDVSSLMLNDDMDIDAVAFSRLTIGGFETSHRKASTDHVPHAQSMPAEPVSRTWSASTWLDDQEPLLITPIRYVFEDNSFLNVGFTNSPAPTRQGTMDENAAATLSDELDIPPESRSPSLDSLTPTATKTCFEAVPSRPDLPLSNPTRRTC